MKKFTRYSPFQRGLCPAMSEDKNGRWLDSHEVIPYIEELESKIPHWHNIADEKPEYGKNIIVKSSKGTIAQARLVNLPNKGEMWIENCIIRGTIIMWKEDV